MTSRALITGISGQDGAYLAEHLLKNNYEVYGMERRSASNDNFRLKHLGINNDVKIFNIDLLEQSSIIKLISELNFSEIYNLAAQSFVGDSWNNAITTTQINSLGVTHLLDAIRQHSKESKFYQASTSEMFGLVQSTPQNETTPFYPRSPYGVSKLYSHWMTINYRESFNLHCSSGILFNHESPLRGSQFVTKKIVNGLCNFKKNNSGLLKLGNLDAERDWGFAGDYVKAMHMMLQAKEPDDYVIGTGTKKTVRDFCNLTMEQLALDHYWQGEGIEEKCYLKKDDTLIIEVSEEFFRPSEVNTLLADPSKAKNKLGWESNTSLKELVSMMVEFELNNI